MNNMNNNIKLNPLGVSTNQPTVSNPLNHSAPTPTPTGNSCKTSDVKKKVIPLQSLSQSADPDSKHPITSGIPNRQSSLNSSVMNPLSRSTHPNLIARPRPQGMMMASPSPSPSPSLSSTSLPSMEKKCIICYSGMTDM